MTDHRRSLPSVDTLLGSPAVAALAAAGHPRSVLKRVVVELIDAARRGAASIPTDWGAAVTAALNHRAAARLRPVINATGVVLHTNLGRAPLADPAIAALQAVAAGYSTLEFNLASGTRGSRTKRIGRLLAEITGSEAALPVNNAAGALVLALNATASGREVIISRSELIEIGGSFRIPDILEKSGASLREVGTTNRTHLKDFADAISPATGAILVVHRSNFELSGFVATPELSQLVALAHYHDLPCIHDVGSGLLVDLSPHGLTSEPLVQSSTQAGVDLTIFSGDKLLGGPQAGCLVGTAALIERCRLNPLARAMRADKLTLSALEATLELYHDPVHAIESVPVLQMLTADADTLKRRASELLAILAELPRFKDRVGLRNGWSTPGGGSFPGAKLATTLVTIDPEPIGAEALLEKLRSCSIPVIGRIESDLVVLDPRTIQDRELPRFRTAIQSLAAVE